MKIQKRRSRTVSFRLSDEEYNSLKTISVASGARSVSEFTRSVACNIDGNGNGMGKIEDYLRILNERIEALDHRIHQLSDTLEEKKGSQLLQSNHLEGHETNE